MIGRLLRCLLIFIAALISTSIIWADTKAQGEETNMMSSLQNCRVVKAQEDRLLCYDDVAKRFSPATYKGRLGKNIEPFPIERPHRLRYRSHGVIFVLYLRDDQGNVIQNLHIGGKGEDEYIIDEPGRYSLKVDGSAAWEIWLEEIENPAAAELDILE